MSIPDGSASPPGETGSGTLSNGYGAESDGSLRSDGLGEVDLGVAAILQLCERIAPHAVISQLVDLRDAVIELGRRRLRRDDRRRAYALAGRLAVIQADATFKLGDLDDARTLTSIGAWYGDLARDGVTVAGACVVRSVVEFFSDDADTAMFYAQDGQRHVPEGPMHARLLGHEARAWALTGDVRQTARCLDRGYAAADMIDPNDFGLPGLFFDSFHPTEMCYNATSAMCLLDRPAAAEQHAVRAMAELEALGLPGFQSMIRLDLALALTRQGRLELDRACALVTEAIQISQQRRTSAVSRRADDFLALARQHASVREVREVALRIREWQRAA